MTQTVIVIIIIALAAVAAATKLYKFFKPGSRSGSCSSDQCESCPYRSGNECIEGRKPEKK